MNQDSIRTTKKLVLLWKEDTENPENTYEWLKGSWFSGHYHLRAPNRIWTWKTDENEEITNYYEDIVFKNKIDFNSDFSRLGRILTGNAVGLVLGGGGARGAAHCGIIKALKEHGIPVDIVGGTSIGSMIGGAYAENPNSDYEKRVSSWFTVSLLCLSTDVVCLGDDFPVVQDLGFDLCVHGDVSSVLCLIWELNRFRFTGAGFNRTLQDLFGDKDIEDLWLPYFCVTTDIS